MGRSTTFGPSHACRDFSAVGLFVSLYLQQIQLLRWIEETRFHRICCQLTHLIHRETVLSPAAEHTPGDRSQNIGGSSEFSVIIKPDSK